MQYNPYQQAMIQRRNGEVPEPGEADYNDFLSGGTNSSPPATYSAPPSIPDGSPQSPPYTIPLPPNGNTGITGGIPTAGGAPKTSLYGTLDSGKLDAARGGSRDSAKYQFLAAAERQGGYDPGAVLASLQASDPSRWGGWSASGDKIRYGGNSLDPVFDGLRELDVVHDFDNPNGAAGWGWQDTRAGVGAPTGGAPTGAPTPGGGANTAVGDAFRQALIGLLSRPEPSLSDPELAKQSQAHQVQQQRAADRRRAAAAEQAAAGGTMGGPLSAGIDTILASQGDQNAAYDAGLLADAYDDRRAQTLAALGPALQAMGLDQQQALTIMGLAQNNNQFLQQLQFQIGSRNADLNLQTLIALLGGL